MSNIINQIEFKDIAFKPFNSKLEGVHAKLFFSNGYGVSIIKTPYSYGGKEGLYELAVLKGDEEDNFLCYTTPITSDVEGWLTEEQVLELAHKVRTMVITHRLEGN